MDDALTVDYESVTLHAHSGAASASPIYAKALGRLSTIKTLYKTGYLGGAVRPRATGLTATLYSLAQLPCWLTFFTLKKFCKAIAT